MAKKKYLNYSVKQRRIFGTDRYIATLERGEMYNLSALAEEVSARSSCTVGEVHGMLRACLMEIQFQLLGGNSVCIEGLGTFYPKVSSRLVDTPQAANVRNCVRTFTVGFRPARNISKALYNAGLHKVADATEVPQTKEDSL